MPLRDRAVAVRRHLDLYLFPDSPPQRSSLRGWEARALATAVLAVLVILQLARIGWTGSLNSLWAEDGTVFLHGALTKSFLSAVTSEYAGYLVLVPRLIGEAASALPLTDAPATVSILSASVAALGGFVVWHATSGHIASPFLRAILVLLTVLTPVGGLESIDSASYVSWYMLFATFWILLWRPRTMLGAGLAAAFVVFTALSNPGVWFFLPVAILRTVAIRDRRDLAILAGYFGGGLVQLAAVASSSYEGIEPEWTGDIWTVLLQRVVDGTAFGLRLGGEAWVHLGWPFLAVLTACLVGGLAVGIWRSDRTVRYLAALALPIALAMFVLSIYQRAVATPMLWTADLWNGDGGRYSVVPVMLVISVIVTIIDRTWQGRAWGDRRSWPGLAVAALLLVSMLVSLPSRDVAHRGTPPWDASLEAAERACIERQESAALLAVSPEGFIVKLPCSTIEGEAGSGSRR